MNKFASNGNAQAVLNACRGVLGRICHRQVVEATGLSGDQVTDAMQVLVERGLVRRAGSPGTFRLNDAGIMETKPIRSGPQGPRLNPLPKTSLRSRIWRALRLARRGTLRDILVLVSQGEAAQASEVRRYLNALLSSGHLRLRDGLYILARNTGPKTPAWNKKQKRVVDPNTGSVHELTQGGSHVD